MPQANMVKPEPARPEPPKPEPPAEKKPEQVRSPSAVSPNPWEKTPEPAAVVQPAPGPALQVMLNGKALVLPAKPEGVPYYVMDLLEHSGIDFEHLDRGVELQVNGQECAFSQELRSRDDIIIRYLET